MTIIEMLIAYFLWWLAGFMHGRSIGRRKYEALRMELANKETEWGIERLIWNRQGKPRENGHDRASH